MSSKQRRAILVACVVAVLTLPGCKTVVKEVEVIRTVEVFKPVAVPCITRDQMAARGKLDLSVNDNSIAAARDVDVLARMYRSDHLLLTQRTENDEALLQLCSALPSVQVGQVVGAPTANE